MQSKKICSAEKTKCSLGHAVAWYILTSLSTGRLRPGSKVKFHLAILMEMSTVEKKIFVIRACEQQTHFRSSLLSLWNFSEGEKRRPEMRLLFAGYISIKFNQI